MDNKLTAIVTEKIQQTPDVWSVNFLVNDRPLPAEAGQYISVYFDDTDVNEGKAYSLSSCPGDNYSQITVKRVGLFSDKITSFEAGDTFKISSAYGFFDAFDDQPAIFIGQGVGISPLYSIVRQRVRQTPKQSLQLYYTNKTDQDIIFKKELNELSVEGDLSVHLYVTRDSSSQYYGERFSVRDLNDFSPETCFYICGTVEFTRAIWRQLINSGVSEKNISVEVFFGANDGS